MPTTYTGVGANVTQSTSPTVAIPASGEPRTAASVDTPLQRLTDHVALIWAGAFTGTGANPGLRAVPGGGATPARGALALPSQVTPTAPADGDLWYDGTNFIGRVAGVTRAFIAAVGGVLARTQLPAVGQQISASSASFSTTSTNFVDVTNLSVTLTTTGRPVMLFLQPDGSAWPTDAGPVGNGSIQILRGATAVGAWGILSGAGVITLTPFLDTPAAGTYTYKAQATADSGQTVQVLNWKLVAYEL